MSMKRLSTSALGVCTYNHIHVYIHQVISNRLLVLRWYYNVVQLSYTRVCMVYTRTLAVLSIPSHTKQRSQGTRTSDTHNDPGTQKCLPSKASQVEITSEKY